jgi:ferric-dicitrate binding protein FerR (iron transport regulator)
LIQYLEGLLKDSEARALEQRLNNETELAAEFALLNEIYNAASVYIYPEAEMTNQSWADMDQKIQPRVKSISIRYLTAIAASIAFLVMMGVGVKVWIENGSKTEIVATSEPRLIELEDGSSLILNPGSSVRYNPQNFKESRNLFASGDITFIVQKDPAHPFKVEMKAFDVLVTGTRFRMNTSVNQPNISLYSGSLEVISGKDHWKLKPGESFNTTNKAIKKSDMLPDNSIGYFPLEFSNAPLSDIIRNIEKRHDISIRYPENYKNLRYTLNAEGLSKVDVLLILTELTATTIEEHSGYIELKQ